MFSKVQILVIFSPLMLNGSEIQTSPSFTQEFLGDSCALAPDLTPNQAWHFDVTSSGEPDFNRNIYFLQGDVAAISSSPPLSLSFKTEYAYATSANSPEAAWYSDAGDGMNFDGNVYFLNGSVDGITASSPLFLSFQGGSLNLAPTPIANQAWYYDGYLDSMDLIGNIYFLNGSIDGITHSSLTDLPFLGTSIDLKIDSNPSASWYYNFAELPGSSFNYSGNVYYLIGSDSGIESSNSLTCTFHGSYAPLFAGAAPNTAWYADSTLSDVGAATIYYLQGNLPNISETHNSFDFLISYVTVEVDKKANAAWYYNYYDSDFTPGFSGRIYYLEGSSMEIASSPSASFTFQTSNALFSQSGTESRGWYYDRGALDTSGFDGNIYYLSGSLDGINSTAATFSFQTQSASLLIGKAADTAWYFDLYEDSTTPPFLFNVYYLLGSTDAILSSGATLNFNTNSQNVIVDPYSGGLWYSDYGNLGTNFDGKIYYLTGSTSSISSIDATVSFNSDQALMLSAGPDAVWYYDANNSDSNVYYVKANLDSLSVYGWTSGVQGALLNTVFNTTFAQTRALDGQRSRQPSFGSQDLALSSVLSEANLLVDRGPLKSCTSEKNFPYLLQITPFYDFIQQKRQGSVPQFNNNIAGALATFDVKIDPFIIGGGSAYAYNHAHLMGGLGHANINQETGVVYSSWQNDRLFINATVWGGFYQLNGVREFSSSFTSKYSTQGYTLTPHLECRASLLCKENWLAIHPFIMGDWAFLWQKKYTEKGVLQTSIDVPSQFASLLRTEGGIYFQQFFSLSWGRIELLEKASYINQLPFQQNVLLPLFVGSSPAFSIGTGAITVQNLGGIELKTVFYPANRKIPFFGLDLQGEFGSKLASYFASFEIGLDF